VQATAANAGIAAEVSTDAVEVRVTYTLTP
jgi:hypothetical protein